MLAEVVGAMLVVELRVEEEWLVEGGAEVVVGTAGYVKRSAVAVTMLMARK